MRYVRSVYATIAPLPDPPEVSSAAAKRKTNWLSLGSAVRVGTREYLESWNTLLRRSAKPDKSDSSKSAALTSQQGPVKTPAEEDGPLLTKGDREEMISAGTRMLSNLRDSLIEFLRGYREGKAEEEAKGPIKF